jgi:uncharacterized membrane protein YeiB
MSGEIGAGSNRVRGYDFARALAMIGMVFINFPIFLAATESGTLLAWGANIHAGRAAALFVTLAGVGVALMCRGANPWLVRRTLLLRSLFLLALGSALLLVWRIDILHFYAFFLAMAALFLVTAPRWALLAWVVGVTLTTLIVHAVWPDIAETLDVATAWGDEGASYWSPLGLLQNVFISGVHPALPWFAFIAGGVWIGSHDLTDSATRSKLMALGAALGVGAPLLSVAIELAASAGWLPTATLYFTGVAHDPSPLYVAGGLGTSMFVIALSQAIVARWPSALVVRALVATGQLALTIYLVHALIGVVVPARLFGVEEMPLAWVLVYCAVFCLVVIAAAHVYRLRFERGPVELVMRAFAGETPRKIERSERALLRAPPSWWTWAAGASLGVLVAVQVIGAPINTVCATGVLPQRAIGSLDLLCREQAFDFSVTQRADVSLETHASRDLTLELYQDGELIGRNDDGGVGLNAALSMTLEPGRYRVEVAPYESAVGPYLLTRRDASATRRALMEGELCAETCATAGDGECDDGGSGALYAVCALGSDCGDCGIRSLAPKPEGALNMTPIPD